LSADAAKMWMIDNQLSRRNLLEEQVQTIAAHPQ
jgi:hypothetical protein